MARDIRWAGSEFFTKGSSLLGDDSELSGGLTPGHTAPTGKVSDQKKLGWFLRGQSPYVNDLIRADTHEDPTGRAYTAHGSHYIRAKYAGQMYNLGRPDIPDAAETEQLKRDFLNSAIDPTEENY